MIGVLSNGLILMFVSDQGSVSLSAAVNCVGTTCEEPMTEREVVLGCGGDHLRLTSATMPCKLISYQN